jgi:hypothetical protein
LLEQLGFGIAARAADRHDLLRRRGVEVVDATHVGSKNINSCLSAFRVSTTEAIVLHRLTLPRIFLASVVLLADVFVAGESRGEVVFLANFSTAADADFSLASRGATTQGGAGITTGKQGVPFLGETASEALDLGFRDPAVAGGVQYDVPLADLRSGTIELWIKTGYDWLKRRRHG